SFLPSPRPPPSTLFPYTTLFRSPRGIHHAAPLSSHASRPVVGPLPCRDGIGHFRNSLRQENYAPGQRVARLRFGALHLVGTWRRSEEHTSELQSLRHLVCRLLLE